MTQGASETEPIVSNEDRFKAALEDSQQRFDDELRSHHVRARFFSNLERATSA
jgi:hypothetical protein